MEQVAEFSPIAREHLWKYGWRHGDEWRISLDDSRFTNHSKKQNTGHSDALISVAIRFIKAGEEILEDYSEFDPDFAEYAHLLDIKEPTFAEREAEARAIWHGGNPALEEALDRASRGE